MEWWFVGWVIGHLLALVSPVFPNFQVLTPLVCLLIPLLHIYVKPLWLKRVLLSLVIGMAFFFIRQHLAIYFSPIEQSAFSKPIKIEVTGLIDSVVIEQQGQKNAINMNLIVLKGNDQLKKGSVVRVNWFKPKKRLKQGNVITTKLKLRAISGYNNQFGFDYEQWSLANQIDLKGSIVSEVTLEDNKIHLQQRVVDALLDKTRHLVSHPYLMALVVGEKSLIKPKDFKWLNHIGISHLLAISGLHIGIIYGFLFAILKLLTRFVAPLMATSTLCFIAVGMVWGYVLLIGIPVSALRAALFITTWLLISQIKCNWSVANVYAGVLALSLLWQPFAPLSASWWLSFSAVGAILVYLNVFYSPLKVVEYQSKSVKLLLKVRFYLLHLVKLQLFIFVGMAPVVIYWFGGLSISALINNLYFVPIFSFFVIPLSFFSSIFILSDIEIGVWGWHISDWLINHLFNLVKIHELLQVWLPLSPKFSLLALVLNVALLTVTVKKVVVTVSVVGSLAFAFSVWNKSHNVWIHVLDIGQGTAIIIQQGRSAILYDLGPIYASGFSATESVVQPMLIGLNINHIELVFISHSDSDHRGDKTKLPISDTKFEIHSCTPQVFFWKALEIEVIWPKSTSSGYLSTNDSSCVVKLTDRNTGHSMLLTGDITKKVEKTLLEGEDRATLNSDILMSAHHGSKYSNTSKFIEAVMPQLVVHSAGVNNRFGFPTSEVKQRFSLINSKQYQTNIEGQISINLSIPSQIKVKTYKSLWLPFWKKQNPVRFP